MELKAKEFRMHTSGLLVANDGQIFVPKNKSNKEHFTYGSVDSKGYKQVCYNKKHYRVHRLVAECFLENPDNKPCVDHINMDKSDNRVENLRWATYSENNGGFADQDVGKRKARKLSKEVIQLDLDDVEVARFPSASEVERVLGFKQTAISACCNGKHQTAYKYKWKYA